MTDVTQDLPSESDMTKEEWQEACNRNKEAYFYACERLDDLEHRIQDLEAEVKLKDQELQKIQKREVYLTSLADYRQDENAKMWELLNWYRSKYPNRQEPK